MKTTFTCYAITALILIGSEAKATSLAELIDSRATITAANGATFSNFTGVVNVFPICAQCSPFTTVAIPTLQTLTVETVADGFG
jgi:hypothetical protein